ncbi:MarR family winged helix-turn-helix transcriptional regulator [Boseongicola aestuarii]|uniref:MarR family protein n=1 Tax=Boseongicola aestuarii TaxID=1470561 RepID=A0A238J329_9RHOB|nr:MarR family transcriptional regulator [Boseongicola aestuarii]SMX25066.1 MarR family protein [Boseongicola aestuarii]
MDLNDPHHGPIVDLIAQARRVSRGWSGLSASDSVMTGAERDVLDFLVFEGAATVPQIARSRGVSRQHIQKRADALVEKGLAEFVENPAHKSSRLLEASIKGERTHATASRGEAKVLQQLSGKISPKDIETARAVFRTIAKAVEDSE